MTNTDTADAPATALQVAELARAGSRLVRVTVNNDEAARAVPGVLLVVSIPSSDIEVGGEGGEAALQRLKNVVGRMESPWRPASADEMLLPSGG